MSAIATRRWCRMNGCGVEPDEGSEFCRNHRFAENETNGRALLERMDAGEPILPAEAESTVAADGAESDESAPSSPRMKWTREKVIAAIQDWAVEHGRAPTQRDWPRAGDGHPTFSTAAKYCGGWGAALQAAGFDGSRGRTRNGSAAAKHEEPHAESEREPSAERRDGAEDAAADASVTGNDEADHGQPLPSLSELDRPASPPDTASSETASNPEIGPLDLIRLIEDIDTGTITVTRWRNGDGDQDEATEQRIRQIMRVSLGGWASSEIGDAVIEYIDRDVA